MKFVFNSWNSLGFIFQDFNLIQVLNVYENIVLPLQLAKQKIDEKKIDFLFRKMDIMEGNLDWDEFSTGNYVIASGFVSGILMLGISISVILGTIGFMNFINVIYSSIYDRRREIAVMQSMGMDLGQVYGMLSAEGGYYMLVSCLGGIAVGLPLGWLEV